MCVCQVRLCKLSIYHFQQYVHLSPAASDPDIARINDAVALLQQRLDALIKLSKVLHTHR